MFGNSAPKCQSLISHPRWLQGFKRPQMFRFLKVYEFKLHFDPLKRGIKEEETLQTDLLSDSSSRPCGWTPAVFTCLLVQWVWRFHFTVRYQMYCTYYYCLTTVFTRHTKYFSWKCCFRGLFFKKLLYLWIIVTWAAGALITWTLWDVRGLGWLENVAADTHTLFGLTVRDESRKLSRAQHRSLFFYDSLASCVSRQTCTSLVPFCAFCVT